MKSALPLDYNTSLQNTNDSVLLLTVIVPVYNVEPYLWTCLSSLLQNVNNEYRDFFEVLVINDGSVDHSASVIKRASETFKNIKEFHKDNEGLSDARNYGISRALGRYISFIDSDDVVNEHYINEIIKIIMMHDFDVLSYDHEKFYGDIFHQEICIKSMPDILIVNKDFFNDKPVFAWNKIYNRCLFDDEVFIKSLYYEDVALIPLLIDKSDKFIHLSWTGYFYRQRQGAITFYNDSRYLDILVGVDFLYAKSKSKYIRTVIANQFFTLCLLSLRLPLVQCIKNLNRIFSFYKEKFNLHDLPLNFTVKHFPLILYRQVGKVSLYILLLSKPLVYLHSFFKNKRGRAM